MLLEYVKSSQVLVLLQSKGVLSRPWVIMELYTACTHGVPIVALNVQNANPYNYAAASNFLMNFDRDIDIANPGAAQLLIDHGVEPLDCAYLLSETLPNIISVPFNPNGSARQIQASLADLVDAMGTASAIAPSVRKDEWVARRTAASKKKRGSMVSKRPHGSREKSRDSSPRACSAAALESSAPQPSSALPAATLADIPPFVPELPNSYLVREKDLTELKEALLAVNGPSSAALTSSKTSIKRHGASRTTAHGMGGVGKTTIATALVHDDEIRAAFDQM